MAKEGASVPALIEKITEAGEASRASSERKTFKGKTGELEPMEEEVVESAGHGKLIVFLSAKGGIGTSSICANLAHVFNPVDENRVAVMDLVLPIGSIASIVGYDGPMNIIEAAAMTSAEASLEYLDKSLPEPEKWNFQLLAGSPSPEEANKLEISKIPVIINNLRKIIRVRLRRFGKISFQDQFTDHHFCKSNRAAAQFGRSNRNPNQICLGLFEGPRGSRKEIFTS